MFRSTLCCVRKCVVCVVGFRSRLRKCGVWCVLWLRGGGRRGGQDAAERRLYSAFVVKTFLIK